MPKSNLIISYDRTIRYLDTKRTVALRRERMQNAAAQAGFEITKFVVDREPTNFSEQRELHKILDYVDNRPGEIVLVALSPYQLIKAGFDVMLPIMSELYEKAVLVFAREKSLGGRQAVHWALEVRQEMIDERAATIQGRRATTGRRGAGRPRLDVDIAALQRYVKRHGVVRAAKLLGISRETARLRLRELEAIRKL